ncbi:MAG: hypothetical protein N2504_02320 [candidate division WOR-3 bacterium]|nr:hypothetical protein [candidate division WOR-3 bacterium]
MIVTISLPYITSWDILSKISLDYVKKGSHVQSVGPEYLGGVLGNWYLYNLSGSIYGNGISRDSISVVVQLNPNDLPYCPSQTPTVAIRLEHIQANQNRIDTTFQYVRPYDSLAVYGGIGVYRINRNTWEGLDTCVIKPNIAIPIESFDGDQIPDTVWYRPSPGSLLSKNADTVYSRAEIRYKIRITNTNQYPIDSILVFDRYKFRFRENKGFWLISLDTSYAMLYTQFGPIPQTQTNLLRKELQNSSVNLLENISGKFKIVNSKIYFDRNYDGMIYIYKPNGTLERSFYFKGNILDLSKLKGLYIIKIREQYIKFLN